MLRRRRELGPEATTALAKRIAGLSDHELTPWIEQSLFVIGRCLNDYERHPEPEKLEEALGAAMAVTALLEEYRRRRTSP